MIGLSTLMGSSLVKYVCAFLAGAFAASLIVGHLAHGRAESRLEHEIKQARADGKAEADRVAGMFADELVKRQLAELRVYNLDRDSQRRLNEEISKNSVLSERLLAGGSMYIRGAQVGESRGGCSKTDATATTGLDHGAGIRLPTDSGRNILRIRNGIIIDREKIESLQRYIKQECLGGL